jgi:hypothetical protein
MYNPSESFLQSTFTPSIAVSMHWITIGLSCLINDEQIQLQTTPSLDTKNVIMLPFMP